MTRQTVTWLLDQFERVDRAHWRRTTEQITATESGVTRALARAFGKSKIDDLPTYEDMLHQAAPHKASKPAWMKKFEEVNADKRVTK